MEPNQGGIVDAQGKWYFLTHHGSGDWSGRIVSLLPVTWIDGWPMIGDLSEGTPGKMVWQGAMPVKKKSKLRLQTSDEFSNSKELAPQWQWNYQPRADKYSLTERPGWLRMYASKPLRNQTLLKVGNILTQRSFRSPHNEVIVKMDIRHLAEGQHAGLCHFASSSASLGVVCQNGHVYMEYQHDNHPQLGDMIKSETLWIKSSWSSDGLSTFSYSTDGLTYHPFGTYQLSWGYYRGDRIGIFNYNDISESGYIDIDYFHYDN